MTANLEPHACRDCEVCGCECAEACAWLCPCYYGSEEDAGE